jgi:YHS domain-containing protein
MLPRVFAFLAILGIAAGLDADQPAKQEKQKAPREALQAFGDLIGTWKCTGTPTGSRDEVQKGFWTEKMAWEWQFKDKDAWLKVVFEKGKHFSAGELRYVPEKEHFALTLTTVNKDKVTFVGTLETREKTNFLNVEREDGKDIHRLAFSFIHPGQRFTYTYQVKPDGRPLFATKWKVGATNEGVVFAVGDGKPECIVSGGTATTPVSYMGKTYYVCCSGCRDEFNAHAAKYVKEYEEKLKAKKK